MPLPRSERPLMRGATTAYNGDAGYTASAMMMEPAWSAYLQLVQAQCSRLAGHLS